MAVTDAVMAIKICLPTGHSDCPTAECRRGRGAGFGERSHRRGSPRGCTWSRGGAGAVAGARARPELLPRFLGELLDVPLVQDVHVLWAAEGEP